MLSRLLLISFGVLALAPVRARPDGFVQLLPPAPGGGYESTCFYAEPAGAGPREVAVILYFGYDSYIGTGTFRVHHTGINWVAVNVTSPYTVTGSFDAMTVSFGSCLAAPIHIATLHYFSPGESHCAQLRVQGVPDPAYAIPIVSCDESVELGYVDEFYVNGVYDYPPGGTAPACFCPAVSVEATTWGRVKALYRD